MSQWSNSESGILRKSRKKDNFEDLLVFGYACKIFRDDDKALHIDQGKHLIPWMGDERIKIDRYDCRGHLSDLTRFEASSEGYDLMRLDENERKLEQLCDQERYYSLHINEEEEEMYKEEEHKRNQSNEFQYSYDVPMNPEDKEKIPTVPENEENEKYVPSVDLDVPIDIEIPQTMKEYARIEKTAMFVFTQGPQMEILIKAKQSDNPQFNFLNQNDSLYKFYRHVLNAIKTGRYQTKTTKAVPNADTSGLDSSGHYLHPSLVSSSTSSTDLPLPTIPSLPYRPSANCAYTQLVSRIQSATSAGESASQSSEPRNEHQSERAGPIFSQINLGNLTYEQQQQYYQYYIQQQYYEYYKQMTQHAAVGDEASAQSKIHMDPSIQSYFQQMMYAQYFQQTQSTQQSTNPYAQIVSNVTKEIPNSYPSLEKSDITKKPVIYGPDQELPNASVQHVSATGNTTANEGLASSTDNVISVEESPKKPSLLTLIQNYGSDSEQGSSEDEQEEEFNVPEGETKVVIDKMASYVVKNGADFESIVKSRADPRFMFLNKDHEFHKYYQKQVDEQNKRKNLIEEVKEVETELKDKPKIINNKLKEKKIIAPVSFSIKKSKEEPPKEIKSALPIDEETDDEEEHSEQDVVSLPPMISQPPTLVSSNACKIIQRNEVSSISKEKDIPNVKEIEEETDVQEIYKSENLHIERNDAKIIADEKNQLNATDSNKVTNHLKNNGTLDKDDPILEMIDLTEDMLDEINGDTNKDEDIFDLKSDKEKPMKDNRALQLERRRKAMAFLKMKSSTSNTCTANVPDGAKPTIPIIDLSNIRSPRTKRTSSDSLDDEEDEKLKKRSRSRTREENSVEGCKSKSRKGCEKISSKKEKSRKSRHLWIDKKYDINNISELEEGEMVDDKDEMKYKASHKKKKTHKRKRSKSKHGSKNKKKSKRKEPKSNSSDSESSSYS